MYAMMLPAVSMGGRPQEALRRLDELKEHILEPFDQLTGVGRAWALADLGRSAEAKVALAGAREVADTYKFESLRPSLVLVGGIIAERDGDRDEAVAQFRSVLKIALQKDPLHQILLAGALRKQGQIEAAITELDQALQLDPAHPQIHLEMALLLHEKAKYEQARDHLQRAQAAWADADPDFPPAQLARTLATLLE
jgi:tetratricopeptide (TPR) repeat protein